MEGWEIKLFFSSWESTVVAHGQMDSVGGIRPVAVQRDTLPPKQCLPTSPALLCSRPEQTESKLIAHVTIGHEVTVSSSSDIVWCNRPVQRAHQFLACNRLQKDIKTAWYRADTWCCCVLLRWVASKSLFLQPWNSKERIVKFCSVLRNPEVKLHHHLATISLLEMLKMREQENSFRT